MLINNKELGISLAELLVATLILAAVGLAVATAIPSSIHTSQQSETVAESSLLAEKYMERVKYELQNQDNFDNATITSLVPVDDTYTNSYKYTVTVTSTTAGDIRTVNVHYALTSDNTELLDLTAEFVRPDS